MVEASTDKIKLDFVVHIVALPDRLGVDDTYVVVLKSHCKGLLVLIESHS